jgi:hypothetical protein
MSTLAVNVEVREIEELKVKRHVQGITEPEQCGGSRWSTRQLLGAYKYP